MTIISYLHFCSLSRSPIFLFLLSLFSYVYSFIQSFILQSNRSFSSFLCLLPTVFPSCPNFLLFLCPLSLSPTSLFSLSFVLPLDIRDLMLNVKIISPLPDSNFVCNYTATGAEAMRQFGQVKFEFHLFGEL